MSLPRSDYDPRRVCVNPFPFLNNINLGKHRRSFGVYLAGGLVSLLSLRSVTLFYPLTDHVRTAPVFSRNLDILRCRHPLRARAPAI